MLCQRMERDEFYNLENTVTFLLQNLTFIMLFFCKENDNGVIFSNLFKTRLEQGKCSAIIDM